MAVLRFITVSLTRGAVTVGRPVEGTVVEEGEEEVVVATAAGVAATAGAGVTEEEGVAMALLGWAAPPPAPATRFASPVFPRACAGRS